MKFEGDCTEVLIQYVESDETNFKQKNRGIWALSQLANERALPLMHVALATRLTSPRSANTTTLSMGGALGVATAAPWDRTTVKTIAILSI